MTYDISGRHIGGMSQGRYIGVWCEGWTGYPPFLLTPARARGRGVLFGGLRAEKTNKWKAQGSQP